MRELEYPFDSKYLLNKQKRIKAELLKNKSEFIKKKIAILSGSTIGEFKGVLENFLLNEEIKPVIFSGDYNRFYEECMFLNSRIFDFSPEIIYIYVSYRNIIELMEYGISNRDYQLPEASSVYGYYRECIEGAKKNYQCAVIINNFELPPYRVMGNADVWHESGEINFILKVNYLLSRYVRDTDGVYLNDLNYQSSFYGLEKWFNEKIWYSYKYPFHLDAIPLVAYNVSNLIKAILGKSKKLIVCDLDETLWGGIIGEEGVEKLELGLETPKGMAYLDFQKYLKKLSQKGIMLTIASKNEYETGLTGLGHPGGVLKPDDFICIEVNWNLKSANVKNIIAKVNVLANSVVFLDDNDFERREVKDALPDINVPEMKEPALYRDSVAGMGYFEMVRITLDDVKRASYYKENIQREVQKKNFHNYSEFLDALKMDARFESVIHNIQRVTQLLNKTNQFNLRTIRFTEDKLIEFIQKNEKFGFCGSLKDMYGDNGIVTVVMGEIKRGECHILNWIMSCRVFGRELEYAAFDCLVRYCIESQVYIIKGEYIPSEKNSIVKYFYKNLGFEQTSASGDGVMCWKYEIPKHYESKNSHIRCKEEW